MPEKKTDPKQKKPHKISLAPEKNAQSGASDNLSACVAAVDEPSIIAAAAEDIDGICAPSVFDTLPPQTVRENLDEETVRKITETELKTDERTLRAVNLIYSKKSKSKVGYTQRDLKNAKRNGAKTIGDMKYALRLHKMTLGLSICALLIIPLYTVLLASNADIINANLSIIGGQGKWPQLLLWTISSCVFYAVFIIYILILIRKQDSKAKLIVVIAGVIMIASNLFPYVPSVFPTWGQVHSTMAMISVGGLALSMLLLVFALRKFDKKIFRRSLIFLIVIVVICYSMMSVYGINSLVEICSTTALCLFLFFTLYWLRRSEKYDGIAALKVAEKTKMLREQAKLAEDKKQAAELAQSMLVQTIPVVVTADDVSPLVQKSASQENQPAQGIGVDKAEQE